MGLDPASKTFEQEQKAQIARVLAARQKLQDDLLGIDRKGGARATQEAAQSAVERAKAVEDVLKNQLTSEETRIKESADKRRQIADEAAAQRLTAEGPGNVLAIERELSDERLNIARQEAADLETLQLASLDKRMAAREVTLKAEIAAAGKNHSAATAAEEELTNLKEDAEKQRGKITADRAQAEQQLSKKTTQEQIKDAKELLKVIEDTEKDRLQARINLVDDQIALIEAQVEGEVITQADGMRQIRALQQQRLADTRTHYIQEAELAIKRIEAELGQTEMAHARIVKIRAGLADDLSALDVRQARETRESLNKQQQEYKRLAEGITSTMSDVFQDMLEGTLDLGKSIKSWFIKLIADLAAYAATHAIILPIITAVFGGAGGGAGSGASGIIGTILEAVGLGKGVLGALGSGSGTGAGTGTGGLADLLGLGTIAKSLNDMLGGNGLLGAFGSALSGLDRHAGQFCRQYFNGFGGADICDWGLWRQPRGWHRQCGAGAVGGLALLSGGASTGR